VITGGYFYNLTHWEVFNEPDAEHYGGNDYKTYTKTFDAVVNEVLSGRGEVKKKRMIDAR
jgi:hypothetical protein